MTRILLVIASMLAALSPAEACQERRRVHHDAYVNQARSVTELSKDNALDLLDKLGRPRFELDYADAYQFDLGVSVIFFLNGCAVAGVDVIELPAEAGGQ